MLQAMWEKKILLAYKLMDGYVWKKEKFHILTVLFPLPHNTIHLNMN